MPVVRRRALSWLENQTQVARFQQPIVFELEGFNVAPGQGPFLFFLALLAYLLVLLGNGVVASVIPPSPRASACTPMV
ncbi:unnamed protein product [Menidia menidia]|uniref:(Atlantic silverside) hypothetical protein n=1 Tax=Menidia menidia TaxID=238744 RepID=A0A8S4BYQ8_9TELE|nr:unnamed protein product [Menidia menidia]